MGCGTLKGGGGRGRFVTALSIPLPSPPEVVGLERAVLGVLARLPPPRQPRTKSCCCLLPLLGGCPSPLCPDPPLESPRA